MNVPAEDIDDAWRQLAKSPHWKIARLKLLGELLGGIPGGLPGRALRENVGRMNFARHLLEVADDAKANDGSGEPRISIGRREPAEPRRFGARRRVPDDPAGR